MDVVNGKIVETREGRAGIRWAGLEPSSSAHPDYYVQGWTSMMPWGATDSGGALEADHHRRQQPGWKWSSSNWAMEVGNTSTGNLIDEPTLALGLKPSRTRVLLPGSLVRECDRLPADRRKRSCSDTSTRGLTAPQQSCSDTITRGLSTAPTWDISTDQPRHYRFDCSPCSGDKLDEEMTLFESQLTRSVSGHFATLASINPAQEFSSPGLKRKRSGLSDGDLQVSTRKFLDAATDCSN